MSEIPNMPILGLEKGKRTAVRETQPECYDKNRTWYVAVRERERGTRGLLLTGKCANPQHSRGCVGDRSALSWPGWKPVWQEKLAPVIFSARGCLRISQPDRASAFSGLFYAALGLQFLAPRRPAAAITSRICVAQAPRSCPPCQPCVETNGRRARVVDS